MKSVGEVMAIGRTLGDAELRQLLSIPNPDRIFAIGDAYRAGFTTEEIRSLTRIDPWFLENMREIVAFEPRITESALTDPEVLRRAKQLGFADRRIAELTGTPEAAVRAHRLGHEIRATFKTVD